MGEVNLKIFRNIGLLAIVAFSFFYTEKIANFVLESNELYKTINEVKDEYSVASIDAIIEGDYIIPGLNGLEVNIKDSYFNMKDLDVFNEYYLLYDTTYPNISVNDYKDKIINKGNSKKHSIAFILEYDENIINYFIQNNISASLLVDTNTFDKNTNLEQLNNETTKFDDLETLINRYNDNVNICYVNDNNYEICKENNKYLVKTNNIINNNTILTIKNNIESGNIYYINKNTDIKNIQLIINSILYKDLDIVKLSELISEDYLDIK